MKLTKEEFLAFRPCDAGLDFAKSHCFNFSTIWEVCPRGDWLLWLLARVAPLTEPQAVKLAETFAAQAKRYSADAADAADYAAHAAANAAHAAAYAADCAATYAARAAYAATYSATYATDAATYAAARAAAAAACAAACAAARAEQADAIRELIPNPFL